MNFRAKVAFQEIVTRIAPNIMVPFMVSTSPRYLKCDFVQRWINWHQHQLKAKDKHIRNKSRRCLAALAKAVQGDSRSNRPRKYRHWRLQIKYEDLASWIEEFRQRQKEKKFDKQYFELFCKIRKIPEQYQTLILDSKKSPKELALEIMVEQGDIEDPKAFKDIQPKISKLRTKHQGIEINLVIEDFLDLPTQFPQAIQKDAYISVLELVRL